MNLVNAPHPLPSPLRVEGDLRKLTRKDWVRLLLLWLGGIDLRLTMLAVPPLIPLIHRDLHLDEKAVGALVSLPVLLLALASVPGALLIAKLGVRGALVAGLGFVALFGALRGAGSTSVLFAATFLMGVGVAVSQPAFPSLVREWFPTRIAIATAVYSNGILIGETLPVTLTTPVGVLPLAHGDWRWAVALWSIVVLATCIAIGIAAPARVRRPAVPARWWPSWLEGRPCGSVWSSAWRRPSISAPTPTSRGNRRVPSHSLGFLRRPLLAAPFP